MKHLILILIFSQSYFILDAQVCFTYDSAGNRIKREACVVAITNQEMDDLIRINSDLTSELRTISNTEDFSELVIYPNPTSSSFQLKDQHKWIGYSLMLFNNQGKIFQTVTISDQAIDMSYLPTGSYFLILTNDSFRKIAKLFIKKPTDNV